MAGKEPPPAKGGGRAGAKGASPEAPPRAAKRVAPPKPAPSRPKPEARTPERQAVPEAALASPADPGMKPPPEADLAPVTDAGAVVESSLDQAVGPGPRYLGYLAGLLLV